VLPPLGSPEYLSTATVILAGGFLFSPSADLISDAPGAIKRPPNNFGLSGFERPIQLKLFICRCREGGRTPTRSPSADFEFPAKTVNL
jgi:hypothetical protein